MDKSPATPLLPPTLDSSSWRGSYRGVLRKESQCKHVINGFHNDITDKIPNTGWSRCLRNIVEYRKVLETENLPEGSAFDKDTNVFKLNEILRPNSRLATDVTWDALPSPRTLPPVNQKWLYRHQEKRGKKLTRSVSVAGDQWTLASPRGVVWKIDLGGSVSDGVDPYMIASSNGAVLTRCIAFSDEKMPDAPTPLRPVCAPNKYSSHMINEASRDKDTVAKSKEKNGTADYRQLRQYLQRQVSIPLMHRRNPKFRAATETKAVNHQPSRSVSEGGSKDEDNSEDTARYRLTLIRNNLISPMK